MWKKDSSGVLELGTLSYRDYLGFSQQVIIVLTGRNVNVRDSSVVTETDCAVTTVERGATGQRT